MENVCIKSFLLVLIIVLLVLYFEPTYSLNIRGVSFLFGGVSHGFPDLRNDHIVIIKLQMFLYELHKKTPCRLAV